MNENGEKRKRANNGQDSKGRKGEIANRVVEEGGENRKARN